MNKKLIRSILVGLALASSPLALHAQDRYRDIAALRFDYYTDGRYVFGWEDVFIAPLPSGFYAVAAASGEHSEERQALGGRLGLAFDLPGAFYGEISYALESPLDDFAPLHTGLLSCTYESGPAMASLSLTGEFTETSRGGIASPGLRFQANEALAIAGTVFVAFHGYDSGDAFFNFAFLGSGEYALAPEILFKLGGTFATVYEPEDSFEKWSALSAVKVLPSDSISVNCQFEYTGSINHPSNPYGIYSIALIGDFKLGSRN